MKDVLSAIPDYCVEVYSIKIPSNRSQATLDKYQDLLDGGYDDKFKTYAKYRGLSLPPDRQRPDESLRARSGPTVYWYLNDEDGFLTDLGNDYGIDPSWITYNAQPVSLREGCKVDDHDCGSWWLNYPAQKRDMKVPNPKDIISSAMTNLTIVNDMLADAVADTASLMYTGSPDDVVTASELPVFMTEFSVDPMEKIAKSAKEIEATEKKEMILNFVMSFLMVVPAVGEAVDAVKLAAVGRIITLTGAVGITAFGVYGLVEDPKSALIALFAALVGFKGETGFSRAAEVRRGMTTKEVSALGSAIKDKTNMLDSIPKICK